MLRQRAERRSLARESGAPTVPESPAKNIKGICHPTAQTATVRAVGSQVAQDLPHQLALVDLAALVALAVGGGYFTAVLASDHVHTWPAIAAACVLAIVLAVCALAGEESEAVSS